MKAILQLAFPVLLLSFFCASCWSVSEDISETLIEEGLKPIYAPNADWQTIRTTAPVPIRKLGKIYYKDNHIFVNELYEGIHIIDNSDPSNPTFVKFIHIVGSKDIAIKGNYLYADNVNDLVVLNIENLENIRLENRVSALYPASAQSHPQAYQGFFECADENRIVIGWEEASLQNPKCWK